MGNLEIWFAMLTKIIGSLRKDDGDGNENGKKAIGLDKENNNLHVHHAIFSFLSMLL